MRVILLAAALLTATSCLKQNRTWTKAGADRQDFNTAKYTCMQEARVPGTPYVAPPKAGGYDVASGLAAGFLRGMAEKQARKNASPHTDKELYDACMMARGFRLKSG